MWFWMVFIVYLARVCIGGSFEYNVKAVVLFYKDSAGRFLLSAGPLPEGTDKVIRRDIKDLLNDELPIEVMSLYTNLSDIPFDTDIMSNITQKYPKIHVASLTKAASDKIIHAMRKHISLDINTSSYRRVKDDNRVNGTVAGREGYKGEKLSANQLKKKKKGVLHSPDNYVPNDVFYTIDFSCVNWDTGCRLKPEYYMLASNFLPGPERDGTFPILA